MQKTGLEAGTKREKSGKFSGLPWQRGKAMPGKGRGKASRDTAAGMMLERPWGSLPKGGLPMLHFLRDVLVAFVAGVLVAVVATVCFALGGEARQGGDFALC